MNRPAPIRRALWQEAAEPSQSDPFSPLSLSARYILHLGINMETFKNTDFSPIRSTFSFSTESVPADRTRTAGDPVGKKTKKNKRCGLSWEKNFEAEY